MNQSACEIGSGAFISLQETGDMAKEVLFALLKTKPLTQALLSSA